MERAGRTARGQQQLTAWLVRRWGAEARWRGHRPPAGSVLAQFAQLAQLAQLPPFAQWQTFARYRAGCAVLLVRGASRRARGWTCSPQVGGDVLARTIVEGVRR